MRRPSFQFYPADWIGSINLKRCTASEKGAWIDLLCLMHDAPEYGIIRWPLAEIGRTLAHRVRDLTALSHKGVLKGIDSGLCAPFVYVPRSGRKNGTPVTLIEAQPGPIWYSSRMIEDEHKRIVRENNLTQAPMHRNGDAKGEAPMHRNGDAKGESPMHRNGDAKGVHPCIHLSEDEEEERGYQVRISQDYPQRGMAGNLKTDEGELD